ncbi:MAG: exonuclease domain-containing protein, partial [Pseudomonadota bacterium]|nr:exonuclease domain-containing protein [Pseudomonadota bacterium]
GLRFEEIKAPGDQLRRNQLVSIQRLQQAGFEVAVTTVNWVRDPEQPYVVVDIETTGGNNSYNRITEIGMVKLIAGEEVARYQTLLNPQRRIPSNITRLTGISDEMVKDAPLFSEVANDIAEFTEDAVFVAHNVNFDYGFIKQEFARLEQSFRRPKMCTVREMRRTHPGLPSYSLANLTKHFYISMERHHRALSDAKAAAELLKLAFEKDDEVNDLAND